MGFIKFISNRTVFSSSTGLTKWILRLGVLSASITVAIMILSSSIINGFQEEIEEKIFGFWGHVQINTASFSQSYESVPIKRVASFIDTLRHIENVTVSKRNSETFTSQGGIRHVQSTALLPGIIQKDGSLEGIILKGIDKDFDDTFFSKFLRKGEALVVGESSLDKIVISEQTAQRLELDLEDRLSLLFVINDKQYPRKFVVSGIYRTGLEEYDRKFVLVDIREIQQLLKWDDDEIGELEIFVDNLQDAPIIADYIYYELLEDDLYCESIKDKYPGIFEWLELQNVNELVILGLMLLVCVLNMITTMLILILERLQMIGILKAIGANNWSIRKLFIRHGLYILVKGLVLGNIIGLGFSFIQKTTGFLKLNEADYYLDTVPISFDWIFIIGINIGTVLIVFLFLLLPSILISRISPVKVIQFK
jgi:lipoprotein-releasing system permease protein